ncbi:PIN domain nuclease [Dactylosporangium matsuzakiense]|uniref:Ribonuclease VapC n=1 Tax=Dactylosporangium matsuzakiense TaxID=53360 RepID=A0A9W6KJ69_9ACTN|nr:PIN domain nuclease [Dactylosporangium matsuzakiense]UWZ46644.1 PIN domain nuclease [Dactylosporangium matsuzakiense]GLL01221.1 ribonuclease VapC [Dactylosporangium matsuzakiense]
MTPVRFLVDTSALVRLLRNHQLRVRWEPQITAGVIGICPITELELLHSARSKTDREEWLELLNATFAWVPMPEQIFVRATEVQAAMTASGTHRSAGAVDLLLAATAELSGLTLVHYDHDFDEIVKTTGQAAVWLAPAGSIS